MEFLVCALCSADTDGESAASLGYVRLLAVDAPGRKRPARWLCGACVAEVAAARLVAEDSEDTTPDLDCG